MPREIKQGDRWFQTENTGLAAVLVALDFKFWDEEKACDLREVNGKVKATWVFEESVHDVEAMEVLKAWKNAEKYCEDNPMCPIGTAIAAVKNLKVFNKGVKEGIPLVCYEIGPNKMWVPKGSDKDKKLSQIPKAKRI